MLDAIAPAGFSCNITYSDMFDYGASYSSNTGAFDAMISDGSIDLISNKTLFEKIQRLYIFYNPGLLNFYNSNREASSNLKYKWAHLFTYESNKNISEAKDSTLIADLQFTSRALSFTAVNL